MPTSLFFLICKDMAQGHTIRKLINDNFYTTYIIVTIFKELLELGYVIKIE